MLSVFRHIYATISRFLAIKNTLPSSLPGRLKHGQKRALVWTIRFYLLILVAEGVITMTETQRAKPFRLKPTTPSGYLSLTETANYLRVSRKSVYRYIASRGLPAEQLPSGRWIIDRAKLESWIKTHE